MKIGISSCLLGNKVRWNGGHTLDHYLTETLGPHVEFIPVCPEVECGLGVPREALRLVGDPAAPRLVTSKTMIDYTEQMQSWGCKRIRELGKIDLCGFIFKSKSPSSGMARIKVYNQKGVPASNGVGIFARIFMDAFPRIPVEDDGRLHDPGIRENFIEQLFTLQRWRETHFGRKTVGRLVDFHTRHKLLILSHSEIIYRKMGKLVAEGKQLDPEQLFDQYENMLLEALKLKTTVKKNLNVLAHIMGYFKKLLSNDEKQEIWKLLNVTETGTSP